MLNYYLAQLDSSTMLSENLRRIIRNQYEGYKSFRSVARLNIVSDHTVKKIVMDLYEKAPKKPGPKSKITERQDRKIKRTVKRLNKAGSRVTSTKVRAERGLEHVTSRTVRSCLAKLGLQYAAPERKIIRSGP